MKNNKQSVAVIGGGFGGLAAAILMAKDGHPVDLYEKNECLGGRASVFEAKGFRFDMGPSRYLMPDVFEEFFHRIGEKIEDHITLTQLDPTYRIFFDDQTIVDMCSDPDRAAKIIDDLEPGALDKFYEYLKRSEFQYEIGMKFVYKNYDNIFDFFTREVAKEGSKLRVFTNLYKYVKRFFKSEKVQKIMMYTLVFLGTSPYQAPALYNIMSHVDFNLGLFYPQGGIHAVIQALASIAEKHGVRVHLNSPVDKLDIDKSTKCALLADIVICNADQARAETNLLDKKRQTYPASYRKKKTFAPSGFISYLGVNKELPTLEHHNLIFSKDRGRNFDQIFHSKTLPDDPSLYICNPSKTDPSVAPKGKENLFMLVPIPNDIEITPEQEDFYKKKAYAMVEEHCNVKFQDDIIYERLFHVQDFKDRYNARQGTALGMAHTLMQTAIFRPNNVSKKVRNLFYVGHNTNPGIGMPMVLISGILVHERVTTYVNKLNKNT